mmetsp:Transcript_79171/g.203940  ORF Transcript_79171/g.203940 Transcript_79171/m.203940 type:complete len:247 (-) Transcript_79171:875-1615(-)
MIVFSLCAMHSSVRPANAACTTDCRRASVCASQLEVGSSMTTMRFWLSDARAMETSCRSPALNCDPPLPTSLSRSTSRPTRFSAAARASRECAWTGSRLRLSGPLKRNGSWGTTATAPRSVCRPIFATSTPSMRMEPLSISTRRRSITESDDLPAPVRPQMPSRSPAATVIVSWSTAGGSSGRYLSVALAKQISPFTGHEPGRGSTPGACHGFSSGTCSDLSSSNRSRLARKIRSIDPKSDRKEMK